MNLDELRDISATYMQIQVAVGPHHKANFLGLAQELVQHFKSMNPEVPDNEIRAMLDLAKPTVKKGSK